MRSLCEIKQVHEQRGNLRPDKDMRIAGAHGASGCSEMRPWRS
jgi:hypothetical protein